MKHKLSRAFRYGITVLATGSAFAVLFWIYSPPKEAISVSPNPIPVIQVLKDNPACTLVKSDRCVILKLTRCKNVTATGRVVTTLVGGNTLYTLPIGEDSGGRKCDTDIQLPVPIPSIALPGKYHFHFRATYKVNPITTITQDYDSESFEVQ